MISKNSIAVLPFINIAPDTENEYFSDGVTAEIINALSRYEELHVTARTSSFAFKNRTMDIREIGYELNVAYILEGNVRRAEEIIRISAQLVKADDGFHLWSESWDRELKNIFILQDEIAGMIAQKVNEKVSRAGSPKKYVVDNTEALDFYLKGLYFLNGFDYKKTDEIIANFRKSIALDPYFSKAYIGLCHAYTWMSSIGLMNAADAQVQVDYYLEKAQTLDRNIPDIYLVKAGRYFWFDWDLPAAMKHINQALILKPSYFDALLFKGLILVASGQVEQSLDVLFQAERINPFAETINYLIGFVYNLTNENAKSLEYLNRNEKIFKGWYAQYIAKVEVLCKLHLYDEAWDVIEQMDNDPNSPLSIPELKGIYYALRGKRSQALEQINTILKELSGGVVFTGPDSYYIAYIYNTLGETTKALEYVEYGMKNNATPFLFIHMDSSWNSLRNHPRFQKAVQKIILPPEKAFTDSKPSKYKNASLPGPQVSQMTKKLNTIMPQEQPYLSPRLSLSDLAELIDVTTNQLSQFLNEHIEKNFYDFVNQYRLQIFLDRKKQAKYAHYTILGLAYECGFNSKTTFNTYFKKSLGVSPSEYFKQSDSE
mgnify:CR=1 FL=1